MHSIESEGNKVLMIARAFPPFLPVGHSIRVIKFIKYLPALGWQPIVLSVDNKKEYETLRKVGSETLLSEVHPDLNIYRTHPGEPSLDYLQKEEELREKNRLLGWLIKNFARARRWFFWNLLLPDRAVAWLPFGVARGIQVAKKEDVDVVFATCPPHSATLVGAMTKLLTRKPLILDFRDDWIDTPWHLSKPAIIRWIDKMLEKWAVKMADRVVLVTEWSRKAFQERYPSQPEDKFTLIPNGCDLGDFKALNAEFVATRNSKFKIVHAGSLNISTVWGRSPAGLFQSIQKILAERPGLSEKLNFVFAGDLPQEFQAMAEEMGLSDVIQGVGHLPHDEVLRLIKSANLLLAMNYEGWATLIPGKIYEYWAVNGAQILLLSCPGAAEDFIKKHDLGFSADPADAERIKEIILGAYKQWEEDLAVPINTEGIEAFDRKSLTVELAKILSTFRKEKDFGE